MSDGLGEVAAIILAAGRGTRLMPLVKEFGKPLFVVERERLLGHALRFCEEFQVHRSVVVAAPANQESLSSLAGPTVKITVQREPTGVIDAIRVGLREMHQEYTLLLCSDNTFSPEGTWFRDQVSEVQAELAMATRFFPAEKAMRFTRRQGERLLRNQEAPVVNEDGTVEVWLGPVFCRTAQLAKVMSWPAISLSLEDRFNGFKKKLFIPMNCADHGVAAEEVMT